MGRQLTKLQDKKIGNFLDTVLRQKDLEQNTWTYIDPWDDTKVAEKFNTDLEPVSVDQVKHLRQNTIGRLFVPVRRVEPGPSKEDFKALEDLIAELSEKLIKTSRRMDDFDSWAKRRFGGISG